MSNIRFGQVADLIRKAEVVTVFYEGCGRTDLWKGRFVLADDNDGTQWENYMEWSVQQGIREDWDFDYMPTEEDYLSMPVYYVDLIHEISGEKLNGCPIRVEANSKGFFFIDDEDGNWSIDI